jgi:cytochrome P450
VETTVPTSAPLLRFDDPTMQNPHPIYARLRELAPVVRVEMPPSGLQVWVLTRYEDVRAALADRRLSKDVEKAGELLHKHAPIGPTSDLTSRMLSRHMLNADPPEHTRLRRTMSKAFTPDRVDALRPRVEALTTELIDGFAGEEEIDLISRFAFPLPLTVICELFGVPEEDRVELHRWSLALTVDSATVALTDDARSSASQQAARSMGAYLADLVERKRQHPTDDMLSALAETQRADGNLTDAEVVGIAFLTLIAGHETVVSLIGNAMLALFNNPAEFATLRAEPALLPNAIEEFLRYDGPAHSAMLRHTLEPVEYGGVQIPEGEFVLPLITSANRDALRFPAADRLDLHRSTAGHHLTFGHGVHYCIGAPLSRMQGVIALRQLFERFPAIRLGVDPDDVRWQFSTLIRGIESLPVRLH